MYEWIVASQDTGSKLITFLTRQLSFQYSARFIKKAIEHNCCQVNGRTERFASIVVGQGDKITLIIEESALSNASQKLDPARILFEDDSLLIYNKPMGINCDEQGILRLIRPYCPSVQLIHRLDRDTTGILLLVKNKESYQHLLEQFKKALIDKCYRAIVDGILPMKEGIIDNFLGKKKLYQGQTIWGSVTSGGFHAHTEWKVIKTGKDATLLYCFPKTGRTHQIRVHMAEMGHPIIGDFQYSKRFRCSYRALRYLLHAEQIAFRHPQNGNPISINAPLPDDFAIAQDHLFDIISD
jgi:23S rRNA pseudouridine955/2504/2580 synthase/23S rRNA pseudouridine1911/1915/1917 synthase